MGTLVTDAVQDVASPGSAIDSYHFPVVTETGVRQRAARATLPMIKGAPGDANS